MTATPTLPQLGTLTVAAIREGLARGEFTAEALTRAAIAQMRALNGRLNAVIFENDAALDTAREIDQRRAAGEALGPLAGVPVVIKDPMDMVGFPTTARHDRWRFRSSLPSLHGLLQQLLPGSVWRCYIPRSLPL